MANGGFPEVQQSVSSEFQSVLFMVIKVLRERKTEIKLQMPIVFI